MGWDEEKRKPMPGNWSPGKWNVCGIRSGRRKKQGTGSLSCFLHYPPTNILEKTSPFTEIAGGIRRGDGGVFSLPRREPLRGTVSGGEYRGVNYMLVSGDYLNFRPALVLS